MSEQGHFSALAAGARIRDYRIERVLGAGGFGITYKAIEAITERAVAIKEYLPSSLAARDHDGQTVRPVSAGARENFDWGLARFRQEAKVLIGLKHHNIVPVLSYFEANATGYLVMEFQDGKSLGQILTDGDAFSEDDVVAHLLPLLDGLEEVHRAGFLHRDIKPDNIFLRRDGSPVLIDFGAARQALSGQSRDLTAVLTEGYAPYEQYERDGNQGPWTDIYALGAVMFRCLVGKRPVEAPTRIAARMRNTPDPIAADLAALRGAVSPRLAEAIIAALAVTEAERPQSVAAFRDLLQRAERKSAMVAASSDHTLMAARGTSPSAQGPDTAKRGRRLLPIYIALGVALAAGASVAAVLIFDKGTGAEDARKRDQDAAEQARKRADEEKQRAEAEQKATQEADRKKAEQAEAETKRRVEEEAVRKAGPAIPAAQQLDLFGKVIDRINTSYVDRVEEKNLIATAIAGLLAALGDDARAIDDGSWRQRLDTAPDAAGRMQVFRTIFERAHPAHAARLGGNRLVQAAIKSITDWLDVASNYIDPETYKEMQVQSRGEFAGVGMEVALEKDAVKVIVPFDDSPAAKGGILPGDLITHIDGVSIAGLRLAEAVAKLRGPVNTPVTVRIKRGAQTPFDVTLTRAMVAVIPVRSRIEGTIGVIRITSFTARTAEGVREALAGFKQKLGNSWAGIVLDLRNNTGGGLDYAVTGADEFLDEGDIVTLRERDGKVSAQHKAKKGDGAEGKPIVVLINKGTSAGAEIVTGALQDHRRATVVGTNSNGRGTVQTIYALGEFGVLRLTTARYIRPSGRPVDTTGIAPDIVVEAGAANAPDPQLARALAMIAGRQ